MADENLPTISQADLEQVGFPTGGMQMAPGLALFLNDRIYRRCRSLAQDMSGADGVTPRHLLNRPAACFAVISFSITWNLSPWLVARSTYETPGGAIGFEGKLVQAILENSGKLEGSVKYTHYGDWSKVKGKFRMEKSQKGKDYPVPTWTREDAAGLGVIVSARVKGESEDRTLRYDLDEAYPLNSTLWATKPHTQLCYTACRAFGNLAMPGIFMGVPFDTSPTDFYGEPMVDVTPSRPTKNEFTRPDPSKPSPEKAREGDTRPAQQDNAPQDELAGRGGEEGKQADPEPGHDEQTGEVIEQGETVAETQQTQPEETADARAARRAEDGRIWYEKQLLALAECKSVGAVANVRDSVARQLEGASAAEWGKVCDARTNALLDAMRKAAPTKGKPAPAGRR